MSRALPADPLVPCNVRLPETLWRELQEFAGTQDLTCTQVVRRALRQYLQTQQNNIPRSEQ
ncbi:MAG TPA: hypothetical protein VFF81_12770 [Noviherbaspirillum sp.]|nr:hypothetical protein [Noviherbaspirillum sp.]